ASAVVPQAVKTEAGTTHQLQREMASRRHQEDRERISRVKYSFAGFAGFAFLSSSYPMIRPILKYGDAGLHQKARTVDGITPDIDRLVDDMIETMYAAPGVGLAAPQVGVSLRIFVVDVSVGRDPDGLIVMINPEFVELGGTQLEEEGCLSVP